MMGILRELGVGAAAAKWRRRQALTAPLVAARCDNSRMQAALVTGASRGVGRGIATALHDHGFRVFATGRGVASARGGYERMVENGTYTWPLPFWQQPAHRWSGMMDAGVRAAFMVSAHAARMMAPRRSGLIVNISYWGARVAPPRFRCGITVPRTDSYRSRDGGGGGLARHIQQREPRVYRSRGAALSEAPLVLQRSGQALVAASVARDLGIQDIDGPATRAVDATDSLMARLVAAPASRPITAGRPTLPCGCVRARHRPRSRPPARRGRLRAPPTGWQRSHVARGP